MASMRQPNVARLPNLPNELLDIVVDQLDDDSIIQLSMTCRKFHFLALPIVFIRAKLLKDTTCLSLQQPPMHLLRALRIALFVDRTTSLVIGLNPDVDRLRTEIQSLNRLISRMPAARMFSFILPLSMWPLFSSNEGGVFDEERWTREVVRLFDNVLDKPCGYFHVADDMIPTYPMSTAAQPTNASPSHSSLLRRFSIKKIGHQLRNLPTSLKRTIFPIVPQSSRHLGSRPRQRILRHFHALSPILFQSHLLSWTTSTLQTSSHTLTEVSFKTDRVPTSTWHNLLSKLTLPSLSKFQITCDRIVEQRTVEFADILNFLIRHPSVIELDLYGLSAPTNSHRSGDLLPALQTLTSHPELAIWLLDCQYPLQQLKSLNIVSEVYCQLPAFDYNTFDDVLALLPRSAPSLTALTISFFSVPGVTQWLDKHISRGHGGPLAALEGITSLEVVSPRSWEGVVMDKIPRFIELFPGLQHLVYPALPPNLDMETVKRMFLREVALTCPRMRKVTIGCVAPVDLDSLREG